MQLLNPSRNIAARMGRWSASHRKVAILGWLAFVIAAVAIGSGVGMKTIDQQDQNVGQAHRADQILKHAGFGQSSPLTEIVVISSKHATIHDPAFQAAVSDVASSVAPFGTIHNLRTPLRLQSRPQVSSDGHTALVEWDMSGKLKAAEKQIDPLTRTVSAVAARHPGFYVGEAGSVSSSKALDKLFKTLLAQTVSRSVPLTLIILLLVFGSLVAAWLPLMLALEAVAATIGLVSLESHLVPMDPSVSSIVLLIGLAVGVDYTLFYLKREREERAAGNGPAAALDAAATTSGRSARADGARGTGALRDRPAWNRSWTFDRLARSRTAIRGARRTGGRRGAKVLRSVRSSVFVLCHR
jgi:RND superfamily putative drug exporter